MFTWLWLIGWSVVTLPLAAASLRGWAPRRVRRRTSPWGIRVRGVALLVIWAGGVVVPLLRWSGLDPESATFFGSMAEVGVLMFAAGLIGGSQLNEWFHRRTVRSQGVGVAPGDGGWPG
ncbi:hypothetical protein M2160_001844 [Streptomyces sp. SAI-117]|uniref:hypothetical protein n=1 Tax=Streptomyces sp. SAI-117 TaxID=2940546 RepID=UPI00247569AF|nr:hypothetical protein [Streptomyces sp. SAI-117]MDH6566823.1 hypothetical protein [Streptomyces sp. SAI-117]